MVPNVVSWPHAPARHIHALFCFVNLVGFTTLRLSFLKREVILCSFLARQCRIHLNFQLSPSVFEGFLIFPIFRIDERNASQPSSVIEFQLLDCPCLFFSFLSGFSIFGPYFRTHILRSGSCLNLCQSLSGPHIFLWKSLFQQSDIVNPFQELDKLLFESTLQ